jgi:hypothetical protein
MSGPAAAQWYPVPGGGEVNDPVWAQQMWDAERRTEEMDWERAVRERQRYDRRQEERLRDLEEALHRRDAERKEQR